MGNNPDRYTRGTLVKLNADAEEQGLRPRKLIGYVTSPYPLNQCVFVKWPHKHSMDCLHVDLLTVVRKRSTPAEARAEAKKREAARKRRLKVAIRQTDH